MTTKRLFTALEKRYLGKSTKHSKGYGKKGNRKTTFAIESARGIR